MRCLISSLFFYFFEFLAMDLRYFNELNSLVLELMNAMKMDSQYASGFSIIIIIIY